MTEEQIKKCHDNCVGKQMAKTLIKESNDKLINDILLAVDKSAIFTAFDYEVFKNIITEVINE